MLKEIGTGFLLIYLSVQPALADGPFTQMINLSKTLKGEMGFSDGPEVENNIIYCRGALQVTIIPFLTGQPIKDTLFVDIRGRPNSFTDSNTMGRAQGTVLRALGWSRLGIFRDTSTDGMCFNQRGDDTQSTVCVYTKNAQASLRNLVRQKIDEHREIQNYCK